MLVEGVAARVLAVAVPIPLVAAALVARVLDSGVLVVARAGALAAVGSLGSLGTVSTAVVSVVVVSVAAFISALAAAGLAFVLTITLVIAALAIALAVVLATILAVVLAIFFFLLLIVARAVPSSGTAAPAAGRAVSGAVVSIHSDNDSRFLAQCGTEFVTSQCAADVSAGALGADGAVSAEESLDIATSSPLHPSQLPQMSLERELVVDNQCRFCKMPGQSVVELRAFRIRSADSRSSDISGGVRGFGQGLRQGLGWG